MTTTHVITDPHGYQADLLVTGEQALLRYADGECIHGRLDMFRPHIEQPGWDITPPLP